MLAYAFARPVDERLWNDELLSEAYPELVVSRAEPVALKAIVIERTGAPSVTAARDRVIAAAATDHAYEHLFLLADYASSVSEHAVFDVVGARPIASTPTPKLAKHHRLALLIEVYEQDPNRLLEIDVLHRWNEASTEPYGWSDATATPFVTGPRADWDALCEQALDALAFTDPASFKGVEFVRAVHRKTDDVVLAFRRPGRSKMRRLQDRRGGLTHDDTWLLVRLYAGGAFADVTGRNPDASANLATRIAILLGADPSAEYRARTVLAEPEDIERLLAGLVSKSEERLPLIEMTWRESAAVTHTVVGKPKETAEASVGKARAAGLFELKQGAVVSAKFRFLDKYTVQLLFPEAGEAPCVTLVDGRLPKEIARQVVEHVRVIANVDVQQSSRKVRRTVKRRPRLQAGSTEEFSRLLAAVVEGVTDGEVARLNELERLGIIDVEVVDWFVCGDASSKVDDEPKPCPGEVEILDRRDGDDRGASEAEWTVRCPCCARIWKPRALRLDTHRRAHTYVRARGVWDHVAPLLEADGFKRDGPGVLHRDDEGRRYVILPGLAGKQWDGLRSDVTRAVCRIRTDNVSAGHDVAVAEVLADPVAAVNRVLAAEPAPLAGDATPPVYEAEADTISRATGRLVVAATDLVGASEATIQWVTGLALLAVQARTKGQEPEFATDEAVATAVGKRMAVGSYSGWAGGARKELRRRLLLTPFDDVFEHAARKGHRVRSSIRVTDFGP